MASRTTGRGPTNFILPAADSHRITIQLSRLRLTLWMCHVHRDGSVWISLMQHSQTSVEPCIHLQRKKCLASTFCKRRKISEPFASLVAGEQIGQLQTMAKHPREKENLSNSQMYFRYQDKCFALDKCNTFLGVVCIDMSMFGWVESSCVDFIFKRVFKSCLG